MNYLPFIALGFTALGGAWLLLEDFWHAHHDEWSAERESTEGLRLIHGGDAEVHELGERRSG